MSKKRKKIQLNKAIANTYFETQQNKGRSSTDLLTELSKEIAYGKYDEKIKQLPSRERIQKNLFDDYVEQARKKATELGYNKLSDLIEDVMKLKTKELNNERFE